VCRVFCQRLKRGCLWSDFVKILICCRDNESLELRIDWFSIVENPLQLLGYSYL
jgi:hypothetical protein